MIEFIWAAFTVVVILPITVMVLARACRLLWRSRHEIAEVVQQWRRRRARRLLGYEAPERVRPRGGMR